MIWLWVLAACVVAYLTKLVGYLLPDAWLENPRVSKVTTAMTIALLASLVTLNSVESHQRIVFDSRLLAVGSAALALLFRAPFIVVVLVGALVAALARMAGLP